jgi:serine/threonine protein kinase
MTGNIGTILYMSPEILKNKINAEYRTKVDVYSFGIIMCEVFFEVVPYHENREQFESIIGLGNCIVQGLRPSVPEYHVHGMKKVEKRYIELMQRCWSDNPVERPDFEEIFAELSEMEID